MLLRSKSAKAHRIGERTGGVGNLGTSPRVSCRSVLGNDERTNEPTPGPDQVQCHVSLAAALLARTPDVNVPPFHGRSCFRPAAKKRGVVLVRACAPGRRARSSPPPTARRAPSPGHTRRARRRGRRGRRGITWSPPPRPHPARKRQTDIAVDDDERAPENAAPASARAIGHQQRRTARRQDAGAHASAAQPSVRPFRRCPLPSRSHPLAARAS